MVLILDRIILAEVDTELLETEIVEVHRPHSKLRELEREAGIHNFTYRGAAGHTHHIYWWHNDLDLKLFATPNLSEAQKSDSEQDFIHFQVMMSDNREVLTDKIYVEDSLTVEKYLVEVRDFIETELLKE